MLRPGARFSSGIMIAIRAFGVSSQPRLPRTKTLGDGAGNQAVGQSAGPFARFGLMRSASHAIDENDGHDQESAGERMTTRSRSTRCRLSPGRPGTEGRRLRGRSLGARTLSRAREGVGAPERTKFGYGFSPMPPSLRPSGVADKVVPFASLGRLQKAPDILLRLGLCVVDLDLQAGKAQLQVLGTTIRALSLAELRFHSSVDDESESARRQGAICF